MREDHARTSPRIVRNKAMDPGRAVRRFGGRLEAVRT